MLEFPGRNLPRKAQQIVKVEISVFPSKSGSWSDIASTKTRVASPSRDGSVRPPECRKPEEIRKPPTTMLNLHFNTLLTNQPPVTN